MFRKNGQNKKIILTKEYNWTFVMEPMCSFSHFQFAIKCSFRSKCLKKGTLMLKFWKVVPFVFNFKILFQYGTRGTFVSKVFKNERNKTTKSGTNGQKNGTKVPGGGEICLGGGGKKLRFARSFLLCEFCTFFLMLCS